MALLQFLNIPNLIEGMSWGEGNLQLAVDLLTAVKSHQSKEVIQDKARLIIEIRSEYVIDDLTIFHNWTAQEYQFADKVWREGISQLVYDLLELMQCQDIHREHSCHHIQVSTDDMMLSSVLVFIMDIYDVFSKKIEDAFIATYGNMNFNT